MPRLMRGTMRRGLTLPEVLVAIIMLAIVGTGLTRVLVKQQQSYKDLSNTAMSKRELRLGATVLPSEIRSISSSGGDIVAMSDSSITMRAYIGSGIICDRTWAASGSAKDIWMPPTNLSRHTLTNFVVAPEAGDTVFVYNEEAGKGSEDDKWEARVITDVDKSTTHCAGAPYADAVDDLPTAKPRYHITLDSDLPDFVKVGAVVRFSRRVRYTIYKETSGKYYLGLQQDNGGTWGTPSPMAGPYTAFATGDNGTTGLQFRYYDSLGTRITDMTQGTRVARADVYLRTNAGASAITERKGASLRDSVVMRVALRNFK